MKAVDSMKTPIHRSPSAGDKTVEIFTDLRRAFTCELVEDRFFDEFECPAGNDAIERQQDKGAEDPHIAHIVPTGARGELLERTFGVALRTAAEAEFREHQRDRNQEAACDIDQDERCAAVLAGHVRESPDVAQTDNRSAHCGDDAEPASE